jgi:hypothetical protein
MTALEASTIFASILTFVFPSIHSSGLYQLEFLVAREGYNLVVSTNIALNKMADDCKGM